MTIAPRSNARPGRAYIHAVKSSRDGGSDIHDVSGTGNRSASSTVNLPSLCQEDATATKPESAFLRFPVARCDGSYCIWPGKGRQNSRSCPDAGCGRMKWPADNFGSG